MIHPAVSPHEFSEASKAIDVPARLYDLEARLGQMEEEGYSGLDRAHVRVEGLAGIASAVHAQEVVAPRDALWKQIAAVAQDTTPFAVDCHDANSVLAAWNFHDTNYPIGEYPEGNEFADMALSTHLVAYAGGGSAVQAVRTALSYAHGDNPVFSWHKRAAALLGVEAEKVGWNKYQFSEDVLVAQAVQKIAGMASSFNASLHARYNYDHDLFFNRSIIGSNKQTWIQQQDFSYNGIDGAAKWLTFQAPADPRYIINAHEEIIDELREQGTVYDQYNHLHATYIRPGIKTVKQFRKTNDWLQQPSVVPVTPNSWANASQTS